MIDAQNFLLNFLTTLNWKKTPNFLIYSAQVTFSFYGFYQPNANLALKRTEEIYESYSLRVVMYRTLAKQVPL